VNGLDNADTYYFTVKAVNALGSSTASSEVWAIPSATVPGVPMGVTAAGGTNGSATITWTAPLNSGGSAVTGYVVTPYVGSTTQASSSFKSPATTETVTGLAPGSDYSFAVSAVNVSGAGAPSGYSNTVTFSKAATTTALKLSATSVTYGHEEVENISVTVSTQYPSLTPTGTVTISGTSCQITLSGSKGSCTLSASRFSSGFYHPVATYSGNANFTGSVSGGMSTLSVTRAPTTTALKLSAVKVTYGHEQMEKMTVTVSPAYAGTTPTGTVTISGTSYYMTLSGGKASCTLSSKAFRAGFFHPIAVYRGDANFKGSASGGMSTLTVVK